MPRWQRAVLAIPLGLAALYCMGGWLAPRLLEPRLEDFSPWSYQADVKSGLVLAGPELLAAPEPFLSHRGRANLTFDVVLSRARPLDSLELERIRYFSPARAAEDAEACRTTFSLAPASSGPLPAAIRIYSSEQTPSKRFRWLAIQPEGGDLMLLLSTGIPPSLSSRGLGCRKNLQIGGSPEQPAYPAREYRFLAAAGSWITFQFERLDGEDAPWTDLGPFRPLDLLRLPARSLEIGNLASLDRARPEVRIASSGSDGPVQLENVVLLPDGLSVSVSGEGRMSGRKAPSPLESVVRRGASGWVMVSAMLLAGCGIVAACWWWVAAVQAPVRVFVSYSHKDAAHLGELLRFLKGVRLEEVEIWSDLEIHAADPWDDVIKRQIQESDILLALVSPGFLESKYCADVEIAGFLACSEDHFPVILPVILDSCDWQSHPWLRRPQSIPRKGTIEEYRRSGDLTAPFLEILQGLRHLAKKIRGGGADEP